MADHIVASIINNDNYRGVIIPSRPEEIYQNKALRPLPFISRVTNNDPIGFKLKSNLFTEKKKKYVNFTEKKNRDFIKLLTKTNKTEKEILEKEEILKKKKA